MTGTALASLLQEAYERRAPLLQDFETGSTDCYRLFHGSQEGEPGLTVDRYGDLLLVQTFHRSLDTDRLATIVSFGERWFPGADLVWNDRSGSGSRVANELSEEALGIAERDRVTQEYGVRFHIRGRHRGNDPWLFLDLRAARRSLASEAQEKSVLNLFSYTCGVGIVAARAGASRVLNVDFARSSMEVGSRNAALNGVSDRTRELVSDAFPAIRQLAGIRQPRAIRGRKLPAFPHVEKEAFDLVVLDPPRLARSPFGVVDLQRDYQSLLKPTLGTVKDGGVLYCTNNVAQVAEEDWHVLLRRCAAKHGRTVRSLDVIRPDSDFPSFDNRPPLKVVRLGF